MLPIRTALCSAIDMQEPRTAIPRPLSALHWPFIERLQFRLSNEDPPLETARKEWLSIREIFGKVFWLFNYSMTR